MTTINLNADLIDVSDITDRVEELREERDDHDTDDDGNRNANNWAADCEGDEAELASLESLLDELRGNGGDHQWEGDWYPATLIADSYMESYLDELIEDIGDLPRNLPSYLKVTADYDALKMDYTTVEIDGKDYWYR